MSSESYVQVDASTRPGSRMKWIGLGVLGILLLAVALFFLTRDRSQPPAATTRGESPTAEQPVQAPAITPAPTETPAVAAPPPVMTAPTNEVVHFALDRSDLSSGELSRLETFWSKVKEYGGEITIVGHADATGSNTYNQKLSERRAGAVAAALNNLGIGGKQKVNLQGFGESTPVADNSTEEGRQKNRRAEIAFKPQ